MTTEVIKKPDFYQRNRGLIIAFVGVPLALCFFVAQTAAFWVQGLTGEKAVVMFRTLLLISLILSPLLAIVVMNIRKRLPSASRDVSLYLFSATLITVFTIKLFNVDHPAAGIPLLGSFLASLVLPAIGVIDLVRFRSFRMFAIAVTLLITLSFDIPPVGFNLARDCLDDQRDAVLAEIEELGSDSDLNFENSRSGQCGTIRWRSVEFNETTNSITLPRSGGMLEADGLRWLPDARACGDVVVIGCTTARDLGGGWFAYTRVRTAN